MFKNKKQIGVILITSSIWVFALAGLAFGLKSKVEIVNIGSLVPVIKARKDIHVGEVISSDMLGTQLVKKSEVVEGSIIDPESIIGKRAIGNINRNEQVTENRVITSMLDFQSNHKLYTITTNINSTNANSIKPFDFVDIRVKYPDGRPTEVVLAKKLVYDIKSSTGQKITDDQKTAPGFASFILDEEEMLLLDDASKHGTLYMVKYIDNTAEAAAETYNPLWTR